MLIQSHLSLKSLQHVSTYLDIKKSLRHKASFNYLKEAILTSERMSWIVDFIHISSEEVNLFMTRSSVDKL